MISNDKNYSRQFCLQLLNKLKISRPRGWGIVCDIFNLTEEKLIYIVKDAKRLYNFKQGVRYVQFVSTIPGPDVYYRDAEGIRRLQEGWRKKLCAEIRHFCSEGWPSWVYKAPKSGFTSGSCTDRKHST